MASEARTCRSEVVLKFRDRNIQSGFQGGLKPSRPFADRGNSGMSITPNSGNAGETTRQRVCGYVIGVGGMCIVGALFLVPNLWRAALWLASIGIILAFIGGMLQAIWRNDGIR